MKASFKQGLAGSARTRLYDKDSYGALIWLAFASRALLLAADQLDSAE